LTSNYLENNLHKNIFNKSARASFLREDGLKDQEIIDLIKMGYRKTEADVVDYIREREDWSGAVCNSVVFFKNKLYCSNLGDCRAVLAKAKPGSNVPSRHFPLSSDHRPDRPVEKERILKAGGYISKEGRVNGVLMCSRAFGDRELKYEEDMLLKGRRIPFRPSSAPPVLDGNMHRVQAEADALNLIVSPEPDVKVFHIDPNLDAYVVIASDGLWDAVSSKRVIALMNQYLKQYNTLEEVAKALEREARQKGSEDDISIIIVMLKDLKHSA